MENESEVIDEAVTDVVADMAFGGGLPAPVRKNLFKAFGRLCTAAVDYPVACLEGKAAEKRAESEARVNLLKSSSQKIAEQLEVSPEYARVASEKYSRKIIQEQINVDDISKIALSELESEKAFESNSDSIISDDWLNSFEKEAATKSSEEMKLLFGKVLANEIRNPSSFSIRTIKLLSQLDNEAASLFVKFCSVTVSLRSGSYLIDGRVVSLSGNAAQNSLSKYGLSFDNLNILFEYGLIVSDYNCYCGYEHAIAQNNNVAATLYHQNKHYGLVPIDSTKKINELKLSGVALSKAGKELLSIVDIEPNDLYFKDLTSYFLNKNLKLVEIKI
ncbi:putative transcriptional regulator [Aliivibrio wodanis]|uniref:Putative transcriptional regulator n=1 Tax=Aliivibrio wodanis TaxID=80852 RepID=A0A090IAA7_9GAMM|nr:putative transcriptional regulator [Aliivibrio wodanis]